MLVTRLSPVLLIHWSRLCKICKRLCLAGCINMYVCVTSCWVFVLRASWHQLVQLKHSCWREKFNMWLFWCHLPFHWFLFFYVWVWWVFPTWRSPLNNCQCLSHSLSLSVKMETCLAVHQLFDKKMFLLSSGGSWHFGTWSLRWSVDTQRQDSLARWGPRGTLRRPSFLVPHIQPPASTSSRPHPAFILRRSRYQ